MIVGLTGGMGCGITTTACFFAELGADVISADRIARELTRPQAAAWVKIKETFGDEFFHNNLELDRKKLGLFVFGQPAALSKLNALIHPLIIKEIERLLAEKQDSQVVVLEAPLLLEVGLERLVDLLIVVNATERDRLARLEKRDGLSVKEIKQRIATQMPLDEKLKMADVVIYNNKTIKNLKVEVAGRWQEWQKMAS